VSRLAVAELITVVAQSGLKQQQLWIYLRQHLLLEMSSRDRYQQYELQRQLSQDSLTSTVCFYSLCLQFVSTVCVYNLCLQFVSTVCFYSLFLQFVSTVCVYSLCLQFVSTVCVYSLCLLFVVRKNLTAVCILLVNR